MTESYEGWVAARRAEAYAELEHPSDLFLEIHGRDVPGLVENALFALYDQIAEIEGFEPRRAQTLEVTGAGLDDALRSLLSEALYRFATDGFVAADGEGEVSGEPEGPWRLTVRLWGETVDNQRHTLRREVKAVTYHRLSANRTDDGWRATILLDL
jgi:SHS2 domain-containing protein